MMELREYEPLSACMPCHPYHLTQSSAAPLSTASALLREVAGQGAVGRRKATCWIVADNLLTVEGLNLIPTSP